MGPMNGRFNPPLGGFLHFLRPGTTKLPLFPGVPVFGGIRRSWLDVALYAANQLFLLRALLAPELTPALLWPSVVLIPLLGVTDKTLFLAARAEHYWVALVCLTVAFADGPLDLRLQGGLVRDLVLGRHLEAQPPLPVRDHGDDEQRARSSRSGSRSGSSPRTPTTCGLRAGRRDGAHGHLHRVHDPGRAPAPRAGAPRSRRSCSS